MKITKHLVLTLLLSGMFLSCSNDEDDIGPKVITTPEEQKDLTVQNFIYSGMNEIYLYKADVPELADGYFSSQGDKNDFLATFDSPEDLYYEGLVASQDRFSFMTDDYVALENSFSGISTTTGMSYGLVRYCASCSEVFAYIRYILPNTPAEEQGLKRGDMFNRIDGQQMTDTNFGTLLAPQSFTIGLMKLEGNQILELEETASLNKIEYNKNPILVKKVLKINGQNVGYIMYDSFTANYDPQLNDAFGEFKGEGITDLILDVRYNGGGSVRTTVDLAAMITGQFPGEVFMKEEWNEKYQNHFLQNDPSRLLNKFNTTLKTGEPINSLNLDRVYILTTLRSASASELIINGLDPYIDVIQIGETTTGKFTASITLYDSPNFGRNNARTTHKYAIQPLVLKSVNSAGVSDYVNGLVPDYEYREDYRNLGILGDMEEPMIKVALDLIRGNRVSIQQSPDVFEHVGESTMFDLDYQRMYIDDLPQLPSVE